MGTDLDNLREQYNQTVSTVQAYSQQVTDLRRTKSDEKTMNRRRELVSKMRTAIFDYTRDYLQFLYSSAAEYHGEPLRELAQIIWDVTGPMSTSALEDHLFLWSMNLNAQVMRTYQEYPWPTEESTDQLFRDLKKIYPVELLAYLVLPP